MGLPPPSKAQEQMISEISEARVRYEPKLERWSVEYEGRQYVGYGRDWFLIGKKDRLKRVGARDVRELNEFVTYALIERVLQKKKDPLF